MHEISYDNVFAWTDRTNVLSWLSGNPRRFKVFVGNHVSTILDFIPPCYWRHVAGLDNPADSASRGMLLLELLEHELWWRGPDWLCQPSSQWPHQHKLVASLVPTEETELSMFVSLIERPVCQSWKQLEASLTLFVSLPGFGDSPTIATETTVASVVTYPSMSWLMPRGIGLPQPNIRLHV